MEKLYDFKARAELINWPAFAAFVMAVTFAACQMLGLDTDATGLIVTASGVLTRFVAGVFNGSYDFDEAAEVIWAGIQTATAIIAAAIATLTTDGLTPTALAAIATQLPRPVFGKMLDVLSEQLPEEPAPPPAE